MKSIALGLLALIACAAAQTSVNLAAGASTGATLNANTLFGVLGSLNVVSAGLKFTNGPVAATVTFTPVLALSTSVTSLLGDTASFVAGASFAVGFSVTADVQGSGSLSIQLASTYITTSVLSKARVVLVSTPVSASADASASAPVVVPPTSFDSNNVLTWSIAFGRTYVISVLTAQSVVNSAVGRFQVAYNTTTLVQKGFNVDFSASGNSNSQQNTNVGASALVTGNEYVRFQNLATASDVLVTVSQNALGAKSGANTYVAPSGTVGSVGTQFSITASSTGFNGNLTYNSNGKAFTQDAVARYSWYKAASGNVAASGWTKVASVSSVDAKGNLVVTASQSGSFSEWTVAASSAAHVSVAALLAVVLAVLSL